jgi:hypothetical protein
MAAPAGVYPTNMESPDREKHERGVAGSIQSMVSTAPHSVAPVTASQARAATSATTKATPSCDHRHHEEGQAERAGFLRLV